MFCEKLKEARLKKGLKQSEVAEKLGCAATSLTNWENGKVNPPLSVLSKLCEIYEISPLSLLDKEYEYSDIVDITKKPVSERTYDEQVALNFSGSILEKLLLIDAERKEVKRIEETEKFLKETDLLNRFGGSMGRSEIETVKADYDAYGSVDSDILFSFHALTVDNKMVFLSMLMTLILDFDNLQVFNESMDKAQKFTFEKLKEQRKILRDDILTAFEKK